MAILIRRTLRRTWAPIFSSLSRTPRPALADLADDPGHSILGAGGSIDVWPPELGGEQVPSAEHIQRPIAVAVVVTVDEAAAAVLAVAVARLLE